MILGFTTCTVEVGIGFLALDIFCKLKPCFHHHRYYLTDFLIRVLSDP